MNTENVEDTAQRPARQNVNDEGADKGLHGSVALMESELGRGQNPLHLLTGEEAFRCGGALAKPLLWIFARAAGARS